MIVSLVGIKVESGPQAPKPNKFTCYLSPGLENHVNSCGILAQDWKPYAFTRNWSPGFVNDIFFHIQFAPEAWKTIWSRTKFKLRACKQHKFVQNLDPRLRESYNSIWTLGPRPENRINSYGIWDKAPKTLWIQMESGPLARKPYEIT